MASRLLYQFPGSPTSSPLTSGEYMPASDFHSSTDTVHRTHPRKFSEASVESSSPTPQVPLQVRNANLVPVHKASQATLRYHKGLVNFSVPGHISRPRPENIYLPKEIASAPTTPSSTSEVDSLMDINLNAGCGEDSLCSDEEIAGYMSEGQPRLSFDPTIEDTLETRKRQAKSNVLDERSSPAVASPDSAKYLIRRWMRSLRYKSPGQSSPKRKKSLTVRQERWSLDDFEEKPISKPTPSTFEKERPRHKKASSWSSSGLVTAVKSATVGLTVPQSPTKSRRLSLLRNSLRSSGTSQATVRGSFDSHISPKVLDDAAWERARQRRRTLEEILGSEESYVADLKVLVNVYFTMLVSATNISQRTRMEIHRNIAEILALHEELLGHIQQAFSDSEIRSDETDVKLARRPTSRHGRWRSHDESHSTLPVTATPAGRRSIEISWLRRPKKAVLISDPREVADVARVFDRMMPRFFVYEEYGAKYESTLRDMASASKHIPNWHAYERGIEALAHSLGSHNVHDRSNRKGLTFEDLLIKPIQRVCKYPLLFADLYKHTPVIDGPESRAEVEKVLCRLRETTQEINKATNDHQTRARIQRSWQLQDLLISPDSPTAPPSLRLLGHPILCGVLYVAYQSSSGMRGDFMLVVLFKSYLLLAIPDPATSKYSITAIISLGDVRVEKTDNGRGLQCHTALYAWKVAFENEQQLYEMILCACSQQEEEQWKIGLFQCATKEEQRQREDQAIALPLYSLLCLQMKPLGQVFGLPGTLARRLSVQRASTVSPRSNTCQVIIKNTNALKDHKEQQLSPSCSLGRSQSHLTTNRVSILAPKRSDRARMEYQLAGVWTKELLPYPGITSHRGENIIRSSASSVLRKLSKANISGQFSKRSASISSVTSSQGNSTSSVVSNRKDDDKKPTGRPRLYGSKSLDLLGIRNGAVAGPRRPQLPARASSKLIGKRQRSKTVDVRMDKDRTVPSIEGYIEATSHAAPQPTSNLQRPVGLLKAFSTENIRGWFYASGTPKPRN